MKIKITKISKYVRTFTDNDGGVWTITGSNSCYKLTDPNGQRVCPSDYGWGRVADIRRFMNAQLNA